VTLADVAPPPQAREGSVAGSVVLVDPVSGISGVAFESVLLTDVGMAVTVLFDGLLTAVAGAHAASARMLRAIARI
jgi:hypothetical protein